MGTTTAPTIQTASTVATDPKSGIDYYVATCSMGNVDSEDIVEYISLTDKRVSIIFGSIGFALLASIVLLANTSTTTLLIIKIIVAIILLGGGTLSGLASAFLTNMEMKANPCHNINRASWDTFLRKRASFMLTFDGVDPLERNQDELVQVVKKKAWGTVRRDRS